MFGQMRIACLALLFVVLSYAQNDAAADDVTSDTKSADDATDDFNFDDLEDDEAPELGGDDEQSQSAMGGQEMVEDFDLGMPEEDQKAQMNACFFHTMNRVRARRDQLEATVKEMTANQQSQMSPEQALNTLIFSWMMSCYMNIDAAGMKQASSGQSASPELEQDLFSQRTDRPQQVHQASRRQWQLLESVLMEQQKQQDPRGASEGAGARSSGSVPLSGLSGQSQFLYIFVVFGIVFGLGFIALFRLIQHEKTGRDKSSKSQKKADKAEKKLAKKKL